MGLCNESESKIRRREQDINNQSNSRANLKTPSHYNSDSISKEIKEQNIPRSLLPENQPDNNRKYNIKDFNDFNKQKPLSKGPFADEYLVQHTKTNEYYTKRILKKEFIPYSNYQLNDKKDLVNITEYFFSFVVQVHFAYKENDDIVLITDFMIGGDLFYLIKKFPYLSEKKVAFYSAEILLGLEEIHHKQKIYRNLNPGNILIDKKGHLKLADIGLSEIGIRDPKGTNSLCCSQDYLAPEILLNKQQKFTADLWSLGAIIYEMLTNQPPFYNKDQRLMFRNRFQNKLEMQPEFSSALQSLLTGLLCIDPESRLGSKSIDEIKNHEFYSKINWSNIQEQKPPYSTQNKHDDISNFKQFYQSDEVKELLNNQQDIEVNNKQVINLNEQDFESTQNNDVSTQHNLSMQSQIKIIY